MMLRDLDWLVTVADLEHVTDAAAVLGTNAADALPSRSPGSRTSSASGSSSASHDGVHPTPTGELVVAAARDLDARATPSWWPTSRPLLDPDAGVVRLAFLDSIARLRCPAGAARRPRAAPQVRVLLRQEPGHEIAADLAQRCGRPRDHQSPPATALGWLPLQEERLVLAVPPSTGCATASELDPRGSPTTSSSPPRSDFGYRNLVDEPAARGGVAPVGLVREPGPRDHRGARRRRPRGGDPARALRRRVRHRRHPLAGARRARSA